MPVIRGAAKGLGLGAGMAVGNQLVGNLLNRGRNNNAAQNPFNPGMQQPAPQAPIGGISCPACNTGNESTRKFCAGCGGALIAPTAANGISCVGCGTVNDATRKFCGGCGNKVEAPATGQVCAACNTENGLNQKFCSECGGGLSVSENCVSCGAERVDAQKFCGECATPFN